MGQSKKGNRKEQKSKPARVAIAVQEIELDTLYGYLEKAERELLTSIEIKALKASLETLAFVLVELKRKRLSILRLQGMLFGSKNEKTENICPSKEDEAPSTEPFETAEATEQSEAPTPKEPKPKRKGNGRNPASCYTGAEQVKIAHPDLSAGDGCPECPKGKVFPTAEPAVLVRVVGISPLSAKVIELDRFRCNCCGEVFKAPVPEGTSNEKYDESAIAMCGMFRYGVGVPLYRLSKLQAGLGIPLPPATQWKLAKKGADILDPAFEALMSWAAQSDVIFNDDTTMKILDRPDLIDETKKHRKAVYTSGIIAKKGEHRVALFLTGMNHAGENLGEILKRRKVDLASPIQMCDALAANTVGDMNTIVAHCLAHARRKFVEVVNDFPDECRFLLESLKVVYRNDAGTRAMSPPERLRYHQEQSAPTMDTLRTWLKDQIDERKVEPRSGLGKAILYMQKHWERLTLFLRKESAPLDNNLCESSLKRAILHRKNSLFYKTLAGARVGDTFMSLIHSAALNKANPFHYLVSLLRYRALVEETPEDWMPWNYIATLAELGLTE